MTVRSFLVQRNNCNDWEIEIKYKCNRAEIKDEQSQLAINLNNYITDVQDHIIENEMKFSSEIWKERWLNFKTKN